MAAQTAPKLLTDSRFNKEWLEARSTLNCDGAKFHAEENARRGRRTTLVCSNLALLVSLVSCARDVVVARDSEERPTARIEPTRMPNYV